ncbi:L-threonylcarbamoyladenylate synthase [Hyphococcus formosus]|uniref:L-threonylcarbamoyladenylate synthase n=1 Tax=Hyphococcus formosus TaxID=3143534 RepID=UPI00398AC04A
MRVMISTRSKEFTAASDIILRGGLVALPTETVYGLAADATNDRAVARIFEAKGRPQFNPLIIHVASMDMVAQHAIISPLAQKLADAFWPGPLTMVLPRRAESPVSLLVSAGLDTIAVRMPKHELARDLIKKVGRPLAAPSANRSGSISPTTADHVKTSLGDKVDFILDGGPCSIGLESTIVLVAGKSVSLLRPGGIDRTAIEKAIGKPLVAPQQADMPLAPGMLKSHYAPRVELRLNQSAPKEGEAFLGFGPTNANGPYALNLSESGDLNEAAANLFAYLRQLDALCAEHGLSAIAAAPIPVTGLGEAINDRLSRAAAPRE